MTADDFIEEMRMTVERRVAREVAAERDRCAKIAEADAEAQGPLGCGPYAATHARSIARSIRSLG